MAALSLDELETLYHDIKASRGCEDLLSLLVLANRQGRLERLLEALGMEDLLSKAPQRSKKVLVIGASQVSEGKLRALAKKQGFDPSDFEFYLEYDRLKHFDFRKLKYSDTYLAILAGPQPHSNQGKGNAGSAIANMEQNPMAFPPVIRLSGSNELKITSKSFEKALGELEVRVF